MDKDVISSNSVLFILPNKPSEKNIIEYKKNNINWMLNSEKYIFTSIKDTFRYLRDEKILFDGLVNNAGLIVNKPFSEISESDFQNLAQVNWIGPAMIIQKIVPLFNSGAHVLNISSMGGFQGSQKFPGLAGYSSSKGALVTLTECLQSELGDEGRVIFNALCLGAVQTEMLKEAFPDYIAPTSAKQMGDYIADFILFGQKSFAGKVLPVSISTP